MWFPIHLHTPTAPVWGPQPGSQLPGIWVCSASLILLRLGTATPHLEWQSVPSFRRSAFYNHPLLLVGALVQVRGDSRLGMHIPQCRRAGHAETIPDPTWQFHGHWADESMDVQLWLSPDPGNEQVLGCNPLRVTCLAWVGMEIRGNKRLISPLMARKTSQFICWQEGEASSWWVMDAQWFLDQHSG